MDHPPPPLESFSNIPQFDGNISIQSETSKNSGVKPDKFQCALNLPVVATYNLRSFFPKVKNVKNDIIERSIDCAFLSEIWEQKENKKHKKEIVKMLEMEGLKYI